MNNIQKLRLINYCRKPKTYGEIRKHFNFEINFGHLAVLQIKGKLRAFCNNERRVYIKGKDYELMTKLYSAKSHAFPPNHCYKV